MTKWPNVAGFDPAIFREFESLRRNLYATVVELTYTSILGVDAERLASLSLACGTTIIEWLRTVLLISFDCHYYSQLASDGAVVLCKLGDYAAVVQWLVYQPSKLRMRFRLPFAAPISYG